MTRYTILRTHLFRKATLLSGLLVCCTSLQAAASRPNVILIISDDQAWNDYGFMGHEIVQTPNLDRLAGESLVFKRGYVTTSLCRPSLSSMMTGLYPFEHRITGNEPPKQARVTYLQQNDQMIEYYASCDNLPSLLTEAGYLTHQSGKWWEGSYRKGGFTHGMTHGDPGNGGRHGDEGLKIGREGMQPVFDFIDQAGDQPFFVFYAPFMPHTPHTPPKRLLDKYTRLCESEYVARYYAMCEWFDETVGQLVDFVDHKGLRDNTVFLYVCDNGWIQRENQPGYAPRSKRSRYDGGLRTPIFVNGPGRIKALESPAAVSSLDLAPTILTLCGLDVPSKMSGVDLLDAQAVVARKRIYGDIYSHNARDIHVPRAQLEYVWTIEGKWKLMVPGSHQGRNATELYDLLADPGEKKDLSKDHPELVERLKESVLAWYVPGLRTAE